MLVLFIDGLPGDVVAGLLGERGRGGHLRRGMGGEAISDRGRARTDACRVGLGPASAIRAPEMGRASRGRLGRITGEHLVEGVGGDAVGLVVAGGYMDVGREGVRGTAGAGVGGGPGGRRGRRGERRGVSAEGIRVRILAGVWQRHAGDLRASHSSSLTEFAFNNPLYKHPTTII